MKTINKKPSKGGKKGVAKRKYTKRVATTKRKYTRKVKNMEVPMFEIHEGLPETKRVVKHDETYTRIVNTLVALEPNKKHFLLPMKYKSRTLSIAKREFPKFVVRTAKAADGNNVSVWRTR